MLTVGDTAPAWAGDDQTGSKRTSAEFYGKPLLLYFYPKDDTPGCTAEACGFRDRHDSLSQKIAVIGVSTDSVESHRTFIEKYSLPFTLIADTNKTIIGAYGVGTDMQKRVTFLIDAGGVIKKIYQGFDCAQHASQTEADLL